MPKFYIDVCTTFEKVPDRVGRDVANGREAMKLARRYARLLLAKTSYRHIDFKVLVIRNESGRLVANLPFRIPAIEICIENPARFDRPRHLSGDLNRSPAPLIRKPIEMRE